MNAIERGLAIHVSMTMIVILIHWETAIEMISTTTPKTVRDKAETLLLTSYLELSCAWNVQQGQGSSRTLSSIDILDTWTTSPDGETEPRAVHKNRHYGLADSRSKSAIDARTSIPR